MKLHHVAVTCTSVENADLFYQEILGLRKIKTSLLQEDLSLQIFGKTGECTIILFGNDTLAVEVFVGDDTQKVAPSYDHLCLEVAERERLLSRCEARGLTVKRLWKGDSPVIFIEDLDGNRIEVKESAGRAGN